MKEFRGTPGEWEFDRFGCLMANGYSVHTRGFPTLLSGSPESIAIAEANSRLMAASKDLLEALQGILDNWYVLGDEEHAKAVAAITKALGE